MSDLVDALYHPTTGNVMDLMHYRGRRRGSLTIATGGGVVRVTVDGGLPRLVVHVPFFPAPQLVIGDVRRALVQELP